MTTWQQFASIPNGTKIFNNGYDQCVALANHFHQGVLGLPFVPVNSAHEWWTRFEQLPQLTNHYYKSMESAPGAIFVARGGIYDRTHGHIGVVLDDDANFIYTLEQNAGTWRYVGRYKRGMENIFGFLIPYNNPATAPAALEPHQRQVGANPANRRSAPSTSSEVLEPQLAPGVVGNFDGWIYGEQITDPVNSTNIWYRGISGHWFWAGAFTSVSTSGLANLNPPAPPAVQPGQRQVGAELTNIRAGASTTETIIGTLAANAILSPKGWVKGQSVGGVDTWYVVDGGFAWAGAFTSQATTGLTDLTPAEPNLVDPPEPEDPTGPGTDVGPGPVLGTIGGWDGRSAPNFGTTDMERPVPASVNLPLDPSITETTVRPIGGWYEGREGVPNHIGIHHVVHTRLDVAIQTLNSGGAPTAHYVTKDLQAVSMVDERDTASTNNRWMSNLYSINIEMCNSGTNTGNPSDETYLTTAWIMARAAERWGFARLEAGVNVLGHRDLAKAEYPTSCPGEVSLERLVRLANEIRDSWDAGTLEPEPEPDYDLLVTALNANEIATRELTETLKRIYRLAD